MRICSRVGISLIELLVSISLIAMILAFLLPAVQAARESARRIQCSNNLKQMGLALSLYEQNNGSLPPGRIRTFDPRYRGSNPPCTSRIVDKSLFVMILPFLEQTQVYNSINQDLTIYGLENRSVQKHSISTLACPSDTDSGQARLGDLDHLLQFRLAQPNETILMVFTSYAGMYGSFSVDALKLPRQRCVVAPQVSMQANGVFNDIAPIRTQMIVDGLSQTIFLAEHATTEFRSLAKLDPSYPLRYGWYFSGNWGDTITTSFYPPNMIERVALSAGVAHTRNASSLHPGGINVLMGDGSVRFIKDTIETWPYDTTTGQPKGASLLSGGWWINVPKPGVWQVLTTRSGGEIVSADDY